MKYNDFWRNMGYVMPDTASSINSLVGDFVDKNACSHDYVSTMTTSGMIDKCALCGYTESEEETYDQN